MSKWDRAQSVIAQASRTLGGKNLEDLAEQWQSMKSRLTTKHVNLTGLSEEQRTLQELRKLKDKIRCTLASFDLITESVRKQGTGIIL